MLLPTTQNKKVVILGVDAMDPRIAEQLMKDGALPHLSLLKKTGFFSALQTSYPAESAVAWTNFLTGTAPAYHGIFDFIMRDAATYTPYLSFSDAASFEAHPGMKSRRRAEAFWQKLTKCGIPSYVYFCPMTFPAEPLRGQMLSGMGTPDILGMMGRFSFYTEHPATDRPGESRGRIVHVRAQGGLIRTSLFGPKIKRGSSIEETTIPFDISLHQKGGAELRIQGIRFFLNEGSWSAWQRVSFKLGPLKRMHGIIRFYLKSVTPFDLYASPINFNPEHPYFAISYPAGLSRDLSRRIGFFHTQGMPHDTWALTEGRLDETAFLNLTDAILEERKKILKEMLKRFRSGVFFFYFDTLDAIQHMFWRYLDPEHPLYEEHAKYRSTIYDYYKKIDDVVGDVMKHLDEKTVFIVLSDHGFGPFRRAVHLNRWLLDNGFLALREGARKGGELFEGVDWSRTKAYALGFGGIYLNLRGREGLGIVAPEEAAAIKAQIKDGLQRIVDEKTRKKIVRRVYVCEEIFSGPLEQQAPDVFVGFDEGYRASWQTALGAVPEALIDDNARKWSGDHLVDPVLVPGVIFANRKMKFSKLSLTDVSPIVLNLLAGTQSKSLEDKELL